MIENLRPYPHLYETLLHPYISSIKDSASCGSPWLVLPMLLILNLKHCIEKHLWENGKVTGFPIFRETERCI